MGLGTDASNRTIAIPKPSATALSSFSMHRIPIKKFDARPDAPKNFITHDTAMKMVRILLQSIEHGPNLAVCPNSLLMHEHELNIFVLLFLNISVQPA
jgi:hypothetical protein